MELDREDLKKTLHEVLVEREGLSIHEHREHHQFLQEWIKASRERRAMWARIRSHVIGWGIVMAVTGLVLITWDWVQSHVGSARPPSSGMKGGGP